MADHGTTEVPLLISLYYLLGGTGDPGTTEVAILSSICALVASGAVSSAPGGAATQVQYNNAGVFGGITGATSDGTVMTLTNPVITGGTINNAVIGGVTPAAGTFTIAAATSLALGGATIGSNALAVTGTTDLSSTLTITQATANTAIFNSTGYSLTGANATGMVDLAGTWNTSGTPTALKLNITNTASNAASLLMNLQASGATVFSAGVGGNIDYGFNGVSSGLRMKWISTSIVEFLRTDEAAATSCFRLMNNGFGPLFPIGIQNAGPEIGMGAAVGNGAAMTADIFVVRKAAASLQLGRDAAGVTNQMLTAANRITSDGVGANLTIAPGNGRGGAGGSLILSTFTTGGAGVAGTLTPRLYVNGPDGLLQFGGQTAASAALKGGAGFLTCRLADDSDYAAFTASAFNAGAVGGVTAGPFTIITNITVTGGIVTDLQGS